MRIKLLAMSLVLFYLVQPANAQDSERIMKIEQEVSSRQLKPYLGTFENYSDMLLQGQADTMAANTMIKSLNALTQKYPTVNALYDLTTELVESGYYSKSPPLMLTNFHSVLEKIKNYGFGSGKLSKWQFKHMNKYGSLRSVTGEGSCQQEKLNVFYATVKHPNKNYSFGFVYSAGAGTVAQGTLKSKNLGFECI